MLQALKFIYLSKSTLGIKDIPIYLYRNGSILTDQYEWLDEFYNAWYCYWDDFYHISLWQFLGKTETHLG